MKKQIPLIFTVATFLTLLLSACFPNKAAINPNQNSEKVKLEFEILTDEILIDALDKDRVINYIKSEILATLKQTNQSNELVTLDNFIIYENFEITDLNKQSKEDLIAHYDYSIVFDPETYEDDNPEIKPNDATIDTLNLVSNFRFYKSDADTLLIRIKKTYFEKEIYSNWDTLIVKTTE